MLLSFCVLFLFYFVDWHLKYEMLLSKYMI